MNAADILLKVYGTEGAADVHVPDVLASAEEKARLAAIKPAPSPRLRAAGR